MVPQPTAQRARYAASARFNTRTARRGISNMLQIVWLMHVSQARVYDPKSGPCFG
jgi:hypothetical protein